MDYIKIIVLCCLAAVSAPLSSAGEKGIVHATYSVADRISSYDDIVPEDLERYDFIYLMAAPAWNAGDFDLPQEDIDRKYVSGHRYQDPGLIRKYVKTVHRTGGKVLCSFPGAEFIDIATSEERSRKFASMMAAFVDKYDYDGIELDWEHTVTEELHLSFMQKIRAALDSLGGGRRHYWLTTALHSYRRYDKSRAEALSACVDWINIMYYDMGGGIWGKSASHNTPLDAIKANMEQCWKFFPPEKLHIGLASYGFYYKGIAPGEEVPQGKNLGDYGRYCTYTELPALLEAGWTQEWDSVAQCSYFFSPDRNEFMTLDTERSMDAKLQWIREKGFGGVFWWEYHCDWVRPEKKGDRGHHLITDYVTGRMIESGMIAD